VWYRVGGMRSHQYGGGVGYRLTGGHERIEMCLLISVFLGYEYIIPINLRLNLQAKNNICLYFMAETCS
jgi:hypothetical protein